jgi:hypothetical protein
MTNVDAYIPKSESIAALIAKVVQFAQSGREIPLHLGEKRHDVCSC